MSEPIQTSYMYVPITQIRMPGKPTDTSSTVTELLSVRPRGQSATDCVPMLFPEVSSIHAGLKPVQCTVIVLATLRHCPTRD